MMAISVEATRRTLVCLGGWMLCLAWASDGSAQVARYEPRSPTISPYLNLTRPNYGGFPNYYSLVRPEIRQREVNRQQQVVLGRQGREISVLRDEVQRGPTTVGITGTGSWFLAPGAKARFLDSSSYYPQPPGPYSFRR